jgi:hypoxanthine phosphoribosyltransferase
MLLMSDSATNGAGAPAFAHPSERELARILDFYRIRWQYEPRSFPLRWIGDRVLEMFTPDFYLPDQDLYVELTTLRQRLVTKKNRKLRLLRELYPDVNIRLLYKHDYQELLAKYGYAPAEVEPPGFETLLQEAEGVLYRSEEIQETVRRLGAELARDYAGKDPIFVGVLRGVAVFMADLVRATPIRLSLDFLAISSYGPDGPSGAVRLLKDLDTSIAGRHVVLVEDIVDTGLTLRFLLNSLRARRPASLEVCALLDKRARRLVDVPIRYRGFEIADQFVVGYGLDYQQRYRNLPFLCVLRPEVYRPTPPGAEPAPSADEAEAGAA